MKKIYSTLLFILLLCNGSVWAGDVEDADAALRRNDYTTALTKYKIAALKKDAYAQTQVGNFHNEGLGVIQDYAEAVHWYKLAAAQGNVLSAGRCLMRLMAVRRNSRYSSVVKSLRLRLVSASARNGTTGSLSIHSCVCANLSIWRNTVFPRFSVCGTGSG